MSGISLNPSIKNFTPVSSLRENSPLFPYIAKVIKELSTMFLENKINNPSTDPQVFLDNFQDRSYKALSSKQNTSKHLLQELTKLILSEIESVRNKKYSSLTDVETDLELALLH